MPHRENRSYQFRAERHAERRVEDAYYGVIPTPDLSSKRRKLRCSSGELGSQRCPRDTFNTAYAKWEGRDQRLDNPKMTKQTSSAIMEDIRMALYSEDGEFRITQGSLTYAAARKKHGHHIRLLRRDLRERYSLLDMAEGGWAADEFIKYVFRNDRTYKKAPEGWVHPRHRRPGNTDNLGDRDQIGMSRHQDRSEKNEDALMRNSYGPFSSGSPSEGESRDGSRTDAQVVNERDANLIVPRRMQQRDQSLCDESQGPQNSMFKNGRETRYPDSEPSISRENCSVRNSSDNEISEMVGRSGKKRKIDERKNDASLNGNESRVDIKRRRSRAQQERERSGKYQKKLSGAGHIRERKNDTTFKDERNDDRGVNMGQANVFNRPRKRARAAQRKDRRN